MSKTKERAAAIIDTAVKVLKATGWCRMKIGDIGISAPDEDGEHCAIGSLAGAAHILGCKVGLEHRLPILGNHRFDHYLGRLTALKPRSRSSYVVAVRAVWDELPVKYKTAGPEPREKVMDIVDFNDSLGPNDKDKVIRLFRKAAKALRTA